jgi:hypothetical protein
MNNTERLQLNKIIQNNDVEDMTLEIRNKCHSDKIKQDVLKMIELKNKYSRLSESNKTHFNNILENQCSFLFNNYTDIFNRIKKDELDLSILNEFIKVLKDIENSKIDQHDGSYKIGQLLKQIYVDSAIRNADNLDKKHSKNNKNSKIKKPIKISWKSFKEKNNIII